MRSRVVLPEPLRPASATHSPGAISSETRRSAYSPPYLLSIFSQQRPMRRANDCVTVRPHGCDLRIVNAPSASNQIAQHLFRARAFPCVFFFGNRARLSPQLQAKHLIFQRVEARSHRGIHLRKCRRRRRGSRGTARHRQTAGNGHDRLARQEHRAQRKNCTEARNQWPLEYVQSSGYRLNVCRRSCALRILSSLPTTRVRASRLQWRRGAGDVHYHYVGGQEQGMSVYGRENVPANNVMVVNVSGTAPPLQAGGSDSGGGQGAQDAQGAAPAANIQSIPGRLDVLKWPLIAGFGAIFALGAMLLARKPVVAVAGGLPVAGSTATSAPPSAALSQVDAAVGTSLDALKDQMFRLELRRQAGTISEEEYTRERARAEKVLRDLVRG